MSDSLDLAAHPRPRKISGRGKAIGVVVFLLFAVAYVLVILAYQVEGGFSGRYDGEVQGPDIIVVAKPSDFSATTGNLTVDLDFLVENQDLLEDGERLTQGIRIVIYGVDGTQEVRFAQGEPIGNASVQVGMNGEIYSYPFDTYTGYLSTTAETFQRSSGGINETTGQLVTAVNVQGAIGGWDVTTVTDETSAVPFTSIDLERAFSTKAFAFVLLISATSVAVLVMIAALLSVTYRRRFEVALLAWNAAVLFSLPLLRTYLPGNPPIGAAIDIYLYLWLIVISVISIVLLLIAWSEQQKARLLEEESPDTKASPHAS